ncbi:GGDEF domain-containing protein [Methylocaldum sp. MU1018]
MKAILKDLLGLLTSIFVFFGLDIATPEIGLISGISPPAKILAIASVLIIVAGWRFWAGHSVFLPLLLVTGSGFVIEILYTKPSADYLSEILAITLLGSLVYFSHAVSRWFSYVSEELESILLKDVGKPIAKLTDSLDDVNKYLYQSRRSGHPLSVILLDMKESPNTDDLSVYQESILRDLAERYLKRFLKTRLINRIAAGFRRSDMIAMCAEYESRLLIMCPSTSLEECNTVIRRIRASATRGFDLPVSIGSASFPSDGFTLEALIKAAETHRVDGKNILPIEEETEEKAA